MVEPAPTRRLTAALRSALLCILLGCGPPPHETLKIYLLCGQSNMEGQGYTYDESYVWLARRHPAATTLETLARDPDATDRLDPERYSFVAAFGPDWMEPRDDVWVTHLDSATGEPVRVKPTPNRERDSWRTGEAPLQPGFGKAADDHSNFGPELALGHRLGDALEGPVYLFKSDHGATSLQVDWRPPSAVEKRGGSVGPHYRHTLDGFRAFLAGLDLDLEADGVLERYGGAKSYEVAGFVWFQGYHDELLRAGDDYGYNLRDLVADVRSELGDPDLPVVLIETAGRNLVMAWTRHATTRQLNRDHPGSATYVSTRGLNEGHANGIHFELRAENHLEIGWRAAGAILENRYTAGETPTE